MLHVKQSLSFIGQFDYVKHRSFVFVEYSALLLKSFDVLVYTFLICVSLSSLFGRSIVFFFFVTLVRLLLALLALLSVVNLKSEFV